MRIYAHRGASADAPENTLEAFREAVRQGSDGVEFDVMLCGSGELVVCHDERLSRLAGVDWPVWATPYWKLSRADVGTHLGFAPARISTLEAVFDALPEDLDVNVEIKCEALDDKGLSEAVGAFVVQSGRAEKVLVSSFNPLCLVRLAAKYPSLRRGYLLDPDKRFFPQARLVAPLVSSHSIHPHHSMCTPRRVEQWHARGLQVVVWTVDEPERAAALEAMGVDVLITNRPGEMRRALTARR